jgi:hypothetical protein
VGLRRRWAAAAIVLGLGVAGCGAPQYHYVSDSADNAYFKVPPGWHQVSPSSLQAVEGAQDGVGTYVWSEAYDSSATPSVEHVFAATASPVAYSGVVSLSTSGRNDLSFNAMRDLVIPVTSQARQQASADHTELSGFASLSDQIITDNSNDRGIREIFDYDLGPTLETFDLTVLVNSATTKVYFLLVQCSETCFAANYSQIAAVVGSFTVGGGS